MRVYQSGSSDSIATAAEEKRPIVLTWRGSVRTAGGATYTPRRARVTDSPHTRADAARNETKREQKRAKGKREKESEREGKKYDERFQP